MPPTISILFKKQWIYLSVVILNDHSIVVADGLVETQTFKIVLCWCYPPPPHINKDIGVFWMQFEFFGAYGGASGLASLSAALATLEC